MRLKPVVSALLFTAMMFAQADAQELSADRLQNIESVGYQNINFTTSEEQFLRIYPNAMRANTDPAGRVTYAVRDSDGKIDMVVLQFFESNLLSIAFQYKADRVSQYGGPDALMNRARQRFGPPTRTESDITLWMFPTIDRRVAVGWDNVYWHLIITRVSTEQSHDERQARLDAGF